MNTARRLTLLCAGIAAVCVTGLFAGGCSSNKPSGEVEAPKAPPGDKADPANGAPPPIDNTKK